MKRLLNAAGWAVAAVLGLFTLRRALFLLTALLPETRSPLDPPPEWPDVLLLVPVRNEAATLPGLMLNLDRLDYPPHRLSVVFINDGSTDGSTALLERWTSERWHWHVLSLPRTVGKARALNTALLKFPQGEIVAVYDADERPNLSALRHLLPPFADPRVAAVSGRREVSNRLVGPAAGYTAIEGLVHQWITMRAKDRLNLTPASLGANCAYRRAALRAVGGFTPGALLEDTDLTVRLAQAGYRTRFEAQAISGHLSPTTITGYWRQHTRWARGFNEVAKSQGAGLLTRQDLPLPLRLELLAFSLGYLDRLALAAAAGLALFRIQVAAIALVISLLAPLLQMVAALKLAGQPPEMWRQLRWVPLFFGLDIAMAVSGFIGTLREIPPVWEERQDRN
jgi:biofilm PGA synthesis N-glycosyltransferase PgaC